MQYLQYETNIELTRHLGYGYIVINCLNRGWTIQITKPWTRRFKVEPIDSPDSICNRGRQTQDIHRFSHDKLLMSKAGGGVRIKNILAFNLAMFDKQG